MQDLIKKLESIIGAESEAVGALAESSLSRIWTDYRDNQFAIITAWRADQSGKGNRSNQRELGSAVRSLGLGYVRIDGVGQEEKDGKVVQVKEPSLLVKNVAKGGGPAMPSKEFDKAMYGLARKYKQWGIVMHNPGGDDAPKGTTLLRFKDDDGNQLSTPEVEARFTKFVPMKVAQFFSSLKGKTFFFEGLKYGDPPDGLMHAGSIHRSGAVDGFRNETVEEWKHSLGG